MKLLVTLVCSAFFAVANAQNTAIPDSWETLEDTTYHFSLRYPPTWYYKLPGTNTRFFVTSPKENDADKFQENVNCIVRTLASSDIRIKDAEEAVLSTLREKLAKFNLISTTYITWNQAETMRIEYTCEQEAEGTIYPIHMVQYMAVVDGRLFTFTFTSHTSGFAKHIEYANKIFWSQKKKK